MFSILGRVNIMVSNFMSSNVLFTLHVLECFFLGHDTSCPSSSKNHKLTPEFWRLKVPNLIFMFIALNLKRFSFSEVYISK